VEITVRSDDASGAEGVQKSVASHPGQTGIEGCRRIAGIPDGAQGIDEPCSARKVECDEFRH
jgi:hypothetical protein